MPPPKKPKMGRTSLEQFLTDEERGQIVTTRDLRDSEGHSPAGSIDMESSDGEVFTAPEETLQRSKSALGDGETESRNRAILLKTFFRKSHSIDEQKVPASPDENLSTPNSTPDSVDNGDCFPGFAKYRDDADRKSPQHNEKIECFRQSALSHESDSSSRVSDGGEVSVNTSNSERVALTKEQDRLLDTLVASALASSVAQSIIHSRSVPTTYTGTMPNFMYGQRAFTNSAVNGFDTEPHDLSKRTDTSHHTKLLDHRLYENLHNMGDRKKFPQPYRDWGAHDARAITVERSKQYLDAHKRIAGLLSEMDETARGRDTTPMQILEKENILHSVSAQHVNGYFHHLGLHTRMSGDLARFEHRQR